MADHLPANRNGWMRLRQPGSANMSAGNGSLILPKLAQYLCSNQGVPSYRSLRQMPYESGEFP